MANLSIDELHKYVLKVAQTVSKQTMKQVVETATVTETIAGGYKVRLYGGESIYIATSLNDRKYLVEDYVYVIEAAAATNAGVSRTYFIVGLVDDLESQFANTTDLERFMEKGRGWNSIESSEVDEEEGKLLTVYPVTFSEIATGTEKVFFDELKAYKAVTIEGTFSSAGSNSQNYGLKLEYKKDGAVVETHALDINYMQGQPYNMNGLHQKRIFERKCGADAFDSVVLSKMGSGIITDITLHAGDVIKYVDDFDLTIKATNKSYWRNEQPTADGQDTVRLEATLKYLDQTISSSNLEFYWVVDIPENVDLADEDKKSRVDELTGGRNVYCLNDYVDETVIGFSDKVRVFDRNNNFIVLDKNKYLQDKDDPTDDSFDKSSKIPIKFTNKIKCYVNYEGLLIESNEFTLIDYSKEEYSVSIEASEIEPWNIVSDVDLVDFTCILTNNNSKSDRDNLTKIYEWYEVQGDEDDSDRLLSSAAKVSTLRVHGGKSSSTESNVYNFSVTGTKNYQFYCKVVFKEGDDELFSEYTDTVSVMSHLGSALVFTEKYKYYLSPNRGVEFTEPSGGVKSAVWHISDPEVANEAWIDAISKNEFASLDTTAFMESIGSDDYVNDDGSLKTWYVYYTMQKVTTAASNVEEFIDATEWMYPQIIRILQHRGSIWEDVCLGEEINQLNTFNTLTNNGKDEGVYYTEALEYFPTADTAPQAEKTYYYRDEKQEADKSYFTLKFQQDKVYYILNNNEYSQATSWELGVVYYLQDPTTQEFSQCSSSDFDIEGFRDGVDYFTMSEDNYIPVDLEGEDKQNYDSSLTYYVNGVSYHKFTGEEFVTNTTYYEKSDNKQHLYINATYINTGTLRVGSNTNERFYASIHNPEVIIAGFTVNNDSIEKTIITKKEGEDDVSTRLYFGSDGLQIGDALSAVVKDDGTVSVSVVGDITVKEGELYDTLEDLKKTQSNLKLWSLYSSSETKPDAPVSNTSVGWTTEWSIDALWMSQKYDTDIEGDVAWSEPVQIASLQPYSISIDNDFISVPTNAAGEITIENFEESFTPTVYQGTTQINGVGVTAGGYTNNTIPKYGYIQVVWNSAQCTLNNASAPTIKITDLKTDKTTITLRYYRYDVSTPKATATVEVVKQRMGEDGSYVYVVAGVNTIKQLESGYSPASFDCEVYKRIGSGDPVLDNTSYYWEVDGGRSVAEETETSFNTTASSITVYPANDQEIEIACYKDSTKTVVIDKLNINILKDGENGKSVDKIEEYYLLSDQSTGVTKNSTGYTGAPWSTTIPAITEAALKDKYKYLWNYEKAYVDNKEINSTKPTLILTYTQDGVDGESIETIEEYYKCFASTEEVPTTAPSSLSGWAKTGVETSSDLPFKYNCEKITFTKVNKEIAPIITIPQLVAEQPKIPCFIYHPKTENGQAPNEPDAGTITGSWTWNQETDSLWVSSKVDYSETSSRVDWGTPYRIAQTSPYTLSIDEDFISVATDSEGSDVYIPDTTITATLYYGDEVQEIKSGSYRITSQNISPGITEDDTEIENGKLKIYIGAELYQLNSDRATLKIQWFGTNEDKTLAEGLIELVKNKQGVPGEYVYLVSSASTIKKTDTGYSPKTVTCEVYKKVSGKNPEKLTSTYYWSVTGGTFKSLSESSIEITPLNNNQITVECYQDEAKTILIDRDNITVVQDGEASDIIIDSNDLVPYYAAAKFKTVSETDKKSKFATLDWKTKDIFFGGDSINSFGWTGTAAEGQYVWTCQGASITGATISYTTEPTLLPDMDAIKLAAQYQIVANRYISKTKGTWQYPTVSTSGGISILQPDLDDATAETPIIPEGDIGRWCYLYNRTVVSGGAIVTGSVTADKLKVNSLQAVSGTMGLLSAGEIRSNGYKKEKKKLIWNKETKIWEEYKA